MIHLKDILGAKLSNKHRIGKKSASEFFSLIDSWGFSTRRCMDPVDYVYGVLGMLQLKISRDLDPDAVWKHFLYELGNYIEDMKDEEFQFIASRVKIIGINDRAYNVNLQKAKYMHDVYKDLLALQTLT